MPAHSVHSSSSHNDTPLFTPPDTRTHSPVQAVENVKTQAKDQAKAQVAKHLNMDEDKVEAQAGQMQKFAEQQWDFAVKQIHEKILKPAKSKLIWGTVITAGVLIALAVLMTAVIEATKRGVDLPFKKKEIQYDVQQKALMQQRQIAMLQQMSQQPSVALPGNSPSGQYQGN